MSVKPPRTLKFMAHEPAFTIIDASAKHPTVGYGLGYRCPAPVPGLVPDRGPAGAPPVRWRDAARCLGASQRTASLWARLRFWRALAPTERFRSVEFAVQPVTLRLS
jgi:hypothetical protein